MALLKQEEIQFPERRPVVFRAAVEGSGIARPAASTTGGYCSPSAQQAPRNAMLAFVRGEIATLRRAEFTLNATNVFAMTSKIGKSRSTEIAFGHIFHL